jgi:hypothetical protein
VSATELAGIEPVSSAGQPGSNRTAIVLRAAWLSVVLGIVIEIGVLSVLLTSGNAGGIRIEIANAAERVSWPVLICVAIVFAQASGRAIASASTLPLTMGGAGFLAAPLTVAFTKVLQKGMTTVLGATSTSVDLQILMVIGVVRALEYASLAGTVAVLQRRSRFNAWRCALVGIIVGVIFGGIALMLTVGRRDDPRFSQYLAASVNEIILPMGCALILYGSKIMAGRLGRI